ncbi:hypothetical protein [Flagellimonas sp.]|uniref:hypothetical protein n=1 Tax=Flagellimonas sp. TaxID=2058762 RepID=UPI003B530290
MIKNLSTTQRLLAEFMSELSEEAYSAGWMMGLEFALWKAANGHLKQYGRLIFDDKIIERLNLLSSEAEGWIFFDDEQEETFVTLDEWKEMIKSRKTS